MQMTSTTLAKECGMPPIVQIHCATICHFLLCWTRWRNTHPTYASGGLRRQWRERLFFIINQKLRSSLMNRLLVPKRSYECLHPEAWQWSAQISLSFGEESGFDYSSGWMGYLQSDLSSVEEWREAYRRLSCLSKFYPETISASRF